MMCDKTVTLVGIGCGYEDGTLTVDGLAALRQAEYIIGAKRMIGQLPEGCTANRAAAVKAPDILTLIQQSPCMDICIVFSGDTGFYSGTKGLIPLLRDAGIQTRILPGISSVQAFAAKLGQAWQDWALFSAHGVTCDPVSAIMTASASGKPAFFLTGGESDPASLCKQLTEAGLGTLSVTAGENLSYPEERIVSGTAEGFSVMSFSPLSVLLVQPALCCGRRTPGIPDEAFIRDKVPMTKQEVRAAILSKLAIKPADICWDIGAGTGSVSVELALQGKAVYAVEYKPEACTLVRANRERFGTWNLHLTKGMAPEALKDLPKPDAVFVGGSSGNLSAILQAVHEVNPQARICVSAIALETLQTAVKTLETLYDEVEIVQVAVSRVKDVGNLHLLMAQNPVFLITGGAKNS